MTFEHQSFGQSVVFTQIRKDYGKKTVLHSFSLEVKAGELVCLLGPSGCGKSTILRCLAGFESITSGDIQVGGESIVEVSPRHRGLGMVFQQYSLFPNMSVLDNVAFGLKIKKMKADERYKVAREMLTTVGLEQFEDRFPKQLSGGQQQRVALARALVLKPKVLLLDEPLSALDAKIRVQLRDEIRSIQLKFGITTIFVTHDQEEALAVADRVAVMHDGVIEQIGSPQELYSSPATPFVADFIGHSNKLECEVEPNGTISVCGSQIPLAGDVVAGALVQAYIRPENVLLDVDEQGDFTVTASSFLGSIMRTSFTNGKITLVSQHAPDVQFTVGQRVAVQVRPQPVMTERIAYAQS